MGLSADIAKFTELIQSWVSKTQNIFYSNTASDVEIKMLDENGDIQLVNVPNYKKINDNFELWKNNLNVKNDNGVLKSTDNQPLSIEKFGGLTSIEHKLLYQAVADDNFASIAPSRTIEGTPYQQFMYVTRSNKLKFIGYNIAGNYLAGGSTTALSTMDLDQPYSKKGNKIVKLWNIGFHCVILYDDGSLWGRGIQGAGHLGVGNTAVAFSFVLMNTDVVDYIASSHGDEDETPQAKILKTDGSVWACGLNTHGQGGINSIVNTSVWVKCYDPNLNAGDKAVKIYTEGTTAGYSMIVTESGKLFVAGYNGLGQLGLGDVVQRNTFNLAPASLFNNSPVIKVALGNYTDVSYNGSSLVLTQEGRVYSAGFNTNGTCSTGGVVNPKSLFSEILYDVSHNVATDKVVDILVIFYSSYILTESGKLYACGLNNYGQLGLGDVVLRNRMTLSATNVKKIYATIGSDASDYPSIFITKLDGTLWACGYNVQGVCGVGTITNILTWVQVPFALSSKIIDITTSGYSSACTAHLFLDDGTIYASGSNGYGEVTGNSNSSIVYSHFVQTQIM